MNVDTNWWVTTFRLRPLQPQGKVTPGSYRKRESRNSEEEKNLLLLQESRLPTALSKVMKKMP